MFDANELTTMELIRMVRHLQEQVDALTGEVIKVHLPGAGKVVSVPFEKYHPNGEYAVQIEIQPSSAGGVESVEIVEKQRNGLRVSYKGSAECADIILWIQDRPKARIYEG